MMRPGLRSAAILALLLALAVGAIVAQPRDDGAIYGFFHAPGGCAAPCIFGIRPGQTSADEALALLRAQPWIATATADANHIEWQWNGQQPGFVRDYSGDSADGRIDLSAGIVSKISLATTLPWGNFLVIFGLPDRELFTSYPYPSGTCLADAIFVAQGFEIQTQVLWPLKSRTDLWYSTALVTWPSRPKNTVAVGSC